MGLTIEELIAKLDQKYGSRWVAHKLVNKDIWTGWRIGLKEGMGVSSSSLHEVLTKLLPIQVPRRPQQPRIDIKNDVVSGYRVDHWLDAHSATVHEFKNLNSLINWLTDLRMQYAADLAAWENKYPIVRTGKEGVDYECTN